MRPVKAQQFDEVRIKTVPRYKTSDLSGSEWRFSAETTLLYKGKVLSQDSYRDVAQAINDVAGLSNRYGHPYDQEESKYCDQEGCAEPATVKLQAVSETCDHCGHDDTSKAFPLGYRMFCGAHSTRGDCSLNDNDANYQVVEGQVQAPDPAAESQSGLIVLGSDGPEVVIPGDEGGGDPGTATQEPVE